jgi:hypothetical protein
VLQYGARRGARDGGRRAPAVPCGDSRIVGGLRQQRDLLRQDPSPSGLATAPRRPANSASSCMTRCAASPDLQGRHTGSPGPLQANGWASQVHGSIGDVRARRNGPSTTSCGRTISVSWRPRREGPGVHADGFPERELAVIVNESFARRWFTGREALGAQLQVGGEKTPRTVVGVVTDIRNTGLSRPMGPYFLPADAAGVPLSPAGSDRDRGNRSVRAAMPSAP